MSFHPSDVSPDLQEERLRVLAELFVSCRKGAMETYAPAKGETPWDLGCRSYSRITWAIERAADCGEHPWLTILSRRVPGKQFVFRVGSQPLRFYTGSPLKPTARSLRVDHPELRALDLFRGDDDGLPRGAWVWRLAIGVDAEGNVSQVTLVQVTRGGTTRNPYSIPFSNNPQGNVVPIFQSGIELPKVQIDTWEDEVEAADGGSESK